MDSLTSSPRLDDNRCHVESASCEDAGGTRSLCDTRNRNFPAMIRLHYSNRLEHLIAPLADSVAEHQRRSPLDPVTIVSPSRVIEQFVKYQLAESLGIAANLKFPFLRTWLAKIIEAADPKLKILDADQLQLVLFECLRSPAHRDDPELKPARDYIRAGSNTDTDVEIRTLILAGQLARIFREYSISRRAKI